MRKRLALAILVPAALIVTPASGQAVPRESAPVRGYVERVSRPAAAAAPTIGLEDALPDGIPGYGRNDIAVAWLAVPTTRYEHGVLGDAVEAAELRVRLRDGGTLTFVLGADSVFEDLVARVVDLDGDGRDEVLVVRSRHGLGSSLTAFGVQADRLRPVAETPPIGTNHRWLNPVGVADVDGDGKADVLLVRTPHIGGTLVGYSYGKNGFTELARLGGFSNHVIGSRSLGLSALLDVDGDGLTDAVLPSDDRRTLRAISFARGIARELARVPLPAPANGDFVVEGRAVVVPLADGTAARVSFR